MRLGESNGASIRSSPLFPHQSGRWAKKVRGKLHYFGKVADDPKGVKALEIWVEQKDALIAGQPPRSKSGGLEIRDLCNHFLTSKMQLLRSREITPRTFDDYRSTTDRIIDAFGSRKLVSELTATDFEKLRTKLAETLGVVALSNAIQRIRSVFQYGFDAELMAFYRAFLDDPEKALQPYEPTPIATTTVNHNTSRIVKRNIGLFWNDQAKEGFDYH